MEDLEQIRLDLSLRHHLQYNHYPPISSVFIPIAREAIEKGNQEDWDGIIEMPNGRRLTVAEVIEGLHLGELLDYKEE